MWEKRIVSTALDAALLALYVAQDIGGPFEEKYADEEEVRKVFEQRGFDAEMFASALDRNIGLGFIRKSNGRNTDPDRYVEELASISPSYLELTLNGLHLADGLEFEPKLASVG